MSVQGGKGLSLWTWMKYCLHVGKMMYAGLVVIAEGVNCETQIQDCLKGTGGLERGWGHSGLIDLTVGGETCFLATHRNRITNFGIIIDDLCNP